MTEIESAKARAEASFKRKEEQAREGAKAWAEYQEQRRAETEKTERLRALRLAKEAVEARDLDEKDAPAAERKLLRRSAQR
jgi:hypothetical protein